MKKIYKAPTSKVYNIHLRAAILTLSTNTLNDAVVEDDDDDNQFVKGDEGTGGTNLWDDMW